MLAWIVQQENAHAFCPYFASFFHLALELTKINFIVQYFSILSHERNDGGKKI